MAHRHFAQDGYPNLTLLADEVQTFFAQFNEFGATLATHVLREHTAPLSKLLRSPTAEGWLAFTLQSGLPKIPSSGSFDGAYVVGSQATVLPDKYLKGDHDLDLKIVTSLPEQVGETNTVKVMEMLRYGLNGPTESPSREHFIDVAFKENRSEVREPYLELESGPGVAAVDPGVFLNYGRQEQVRHSR